MNQTAGNKADQDGRNDPEDALRGSREATLGADGLHVTKGDATLPASAPDDSRPSAYADVEPEDTTGEEACASREATLGGSPAKTRPAGGLAPEDEAPQRGV